MRGVKVKRVPFEMFFFLSGVLVAGFISFVKPREFTKSAESELAQAQRILRAPAANRASPVQHVKF